MQEPAGRIALVKMVAHCCSYRRNSEHLRVEETKETLGSSGCLVGWICRGISL